MRRCVWLALLVMSLAGCGFVGTGKNRHKPDGFPLHGYVSVAGAAAGVTGSACLAPATAPDIVAGAEVKAASTDGHVAATSTLGRGVLAATAGGGYRCNFPFELANVSGARPTYLVVVGTRPAVAFNTRELREGKPAVIDVPPLPEATASTPVTTTSPAPGTTTSRSPS